MTNVNFVSNIKQLCYEKDISSVKKPISVFMPLDKFHEIPNDLSAPKQPNVRVSALVNGAAVAQWWLVIPESEGLIPAHRRVSLSKTLNSKLLLLVSSLWIRMNDWMWQKHFESSVGTQKCCISVIPFTIQITWMLVLPTAQQLPHVT